MRKSGAVVVLLLFVSVVLAVPNVELVHAESTIYIRADGSVSGTDKIQREGNVYTFVDDIDESQILVEKDNIIVDGAGFTLHGAEGRGIVLSERNRVTIKNVKLQMDGGYGIYLVDSTNCLVSGNTVDGDGYNIYLWDSFHNTVEGNTVTQAFRGILLYGACANTVTGNLVKDGVVGIEVHDALNNVLRNNQMNNNRHGFSVRVYPTYNYANDVDISNTVDGKPICYWVGEEDKIVPLDVGCVFLVNCTRITVQNMHLLANGQAILLVSTTDSTITQNTLVGTRGNKGIALVHSSNNRITENSVQNFSTGIQLETSSHNTISDNTVKNNDRGIRPLYSSRHNTFSGNLITANDYGIDDGQDPSGDNTFSGNIISANGFGVSLHSANNVISGNTVTGNSDAGILIDSGSNSLTDNNVTDNWQGIYLGGSNNQLRNNKMEHNDDNFLIARGFANDVDTSNTVEGKPVVYWVEQHSKTVPYDAGYVVLVNCDDITVEKLTLSYNGEGILLAYTTNSTITQNVISSMDRGIQFYGASNNKVFCNNITNNNCGIYFSGGGFLSKYVPSPNNTFYNNNFVDNEQAVYDIAVSGSPWFESGVVVNNWDNGIQGNYWSSYNGTDSDGNGIGDSVYVLYENNTDNFPLMQPVSEIPEFPSFVLLSLTMVVVSVVVVVYRKVLSNSTRP
jgi:parallel beta-helix repeat protein